MTELSTDNNTDVAAVAAAVAAAVVVVADEKTIIKEVVVVLEAEEIAVVKEAVIEDEKEVIIISEEKMIGEEDYNNMNSIFHGDFPSDIHEKYTILENEILGKGSFGTVRKCSIKKNTNTKIQTNYTNNTFYFALKTIQKSKLPDPTQLRREVDILLHVDHPHIIKLYDVYEDENVNSFFNLFAVLLLLVLYCFFSFSFTSIFFPFCRFRSFAILTFYISPSAAAAAAAAQSPSPANSPHNIIL